MEAELVQLARAAVAGVQAANQPNWAAVAGVVVSATVGLGQIALIAWGLRQMSQASKERNRQLDIMEASQREQSRAQAEVLGQIGQGIAALLRRPA